MSFKVLPAQPSLGFYGSPAQGMGLESWEHAQGSPSMAQAEAGPCTGPAARTSGCYTLPLLQGHPSSPPTNCPASENTHFLPFLEVFPVLLPPVDARIQRQQAGGGCSHTQIQS